MNNFLEHFAKGIVTPGMRAIFICKPTVVTIATFLLTCFLPANGSILEGGRKALLRAPEARFQTELETQGLIPKRNHDEPVRDSVRIEVDEFTGAIAGATNAAALSDEYFTIRRALDKVWLARQTNDDGEPTSIDPPPPVPPISLSGAPDEFILYLKGAALWHGDSKDAACDLWKQLLDLPPAERHYRSVWAAFMLGKHAMETSHSAAREKFDLARQLARAGYADSLNLADDTLGWEARMALDERNYRSAFQLYLRTTDLPSLRITVASALDHCTPEELAGLSADPTSRKVMSSCLISGGSYKLQSPMKEELAKWLTAIDAAGVHDPETADRLALAAYQQDDLDLAEHWIDLAGHSRTAQWLQAKIQFAKDAPDEAAAILRELSKQPEEDDLFSALSCRFDSTKEVFRELGAYELHLGNFIAALDAFMSGDSWEDAALIAERVLTLEELQKYCDEGNLQGNTTGLDAHMTNRLRELLARRLMRGNRMAAARPYFEPQHQAKLDELTDALNAGMDRSRSSEDRGRSYFAAAKIARHSGMELFGTELAPDFAINGGSTTWTFTAEQRLETPDDSLPPSDAEKQRIKASALEFNERFRYRYIAAELAWLASSLMPNNSDETARMLCESGSWIKNEDPKRADKFYKALVRRCRQTDLGQRADKLRWFPSLEEPRSVPAHSPEPAVAPPDGDR